jgi:protein ImuB
VQCRRLWLCVHLPQLPVDVLRPDAGVPCAAVEPMRNRLHVVACNGTAAQRGVRPGLALSAALSLCAELDARERDRDAECVRLNDVAAAAWQLSATVSLYDAGSVVLEIGGSLKLFDGLGGVLRRAREVFAQCGAEFVFAVAGTPRAAAWLARHRPGSYALFAAELPGLLRSLPVEALGLEERPLASLRRSGVRTVGALLRLPRAGLARRYGTEVLQTLDRALGREPEPLALYAPPQPFRAVEEIHPPTGDWTHLAPLAEKLLRRLEHALLRRQAATQQLRCFLLHAHAPATVLRVETTRCERCAVVFLALLRQCFERTELPAEAVGIGIRCERMHVISAANLDLVDGRPEAERQWRELLDQARARLGPGRLSWLRLHADHRPEKSGSECNAPARIATSPDDGWRNCTPTPISSPPRPAWLLPQPRRLPCESERPCWHGPLDLSKLPERIEAGWWDGMDVSRDYYLARNSAGSGLWVFRDRRGGEWFLQGIFG